MSTRLLTILLVGAMSCTLLLVAPGWVPRLLGMIGTLGLFAFFTLRLHQLYGRVADLAHVHNAYQELDERAKRILRANLELHQTQEELDRRVSSLGSIYHLGHKMAVSSRPEDIYQELDAPILEHLRFSAGLLGTCPSMESLTWQSRVGINDERAQRLAQHLAGSGLLKAILTHPAPRTLESRSATDASERKLLEYMGLEVVVVAAVLPQAGTAGCLVLGRHDQGGRDHTTDEELIKVLVDQLTSAVENSALYEQAWSSKQRLERKVSERTHALAQANAQLMKLNTAKSSFVSAVSHELRTPLAAIKGYASLLGTGQFGTLAKAQAERIAKIEKHADALTALINNMLDIARIESGRITMERQPINVNDFFGSVHDLVRPQLAAKKLRYTMNLDGISQLIGDPQHLQRVFVNLLSNAIKYTPEGGEIQLGLTKDGDSIHATVSDTGCGIPEEDLPKLFEEFYRVADAANQTVPGTGLGLALVKQIVEAHHGTISVTSKPGTGSIFSVTLPATSTYGEQT